MTQTLPQNLITRLNNSKNIWFASVRPDGRPHLVPIWFVWSDSKIYICIEPTSVKARNMDRDPHVSLALEDGSSPIICEGLAQTVSPPWSSHISDLFQSKYDWDILDEARYTRLVEISPGKWLHW